MRLKTRVALAAFAAASLAGCTSVLDAPPRTATYEPGENTQYMFEVGSVAARLGYYSDVCPHSTDQYWRCRTPYEQYAGKRFYVAQHDQGRGALIPIIVETGEVLYLPRRAKVESPMGIARLYHRDAANQFTPEPLVEGSSLQLKGIDELEQDLTYILNDERRIPAGQVALIRRVAAKHPDHALRVAELLTKLYVRHDNITGAFSFLPDSDLRSIISAYVVSTDDGAHLRFRARYFGTNWLFVSSFTVAADDFRWRSPALDFRRDHDDYVWEWVDIVSTPEYTTALRQIASAEKVTVRFSGRQYYNDMYMTQVQRDGIRTVLELAELLGARGL